MRSYAKVRGVIVGLPRSEGVVLRRGGGEG